MELIRKIVKGELKPETVEEGRELLICTHVKSMFRKLNLFIYNIVTH